MIHFSAVSHDPDGAHAYAAASDTLHLRLKTGRGEVKSAEVLSTDPFNFLPDPNGGGDRFDVGGVRRNSMDIEQQTEDHDIWFCEIPGIRWRRLRYSFLLSDGERQYQFGACDHFPCRGNEKRRYELSNYFSYPYLLEEDFFQAPEWVAHTVWYQIFMPSFRSLSEVVNELDYIRDCGFNGIYFTPLFTGASFHKYDTIDYFHIDPEFGDIATFRKLVEEAHRRKIRIMLDAVFNHCSFKHPFFQDVLQHGTNSPHYGKFTVIDPSKPLVYGDLADGLPKTCPREHLNYRTFAYEQYMPKWNMANPDVREYLLDAAVYWIRECDIDGWRLDVSNEIPHGFWREFRTRVKAVKKELYILGENWDYAPSYLQGDQLDGVMNYPFSRSVWNFFRGASSDGVRYNAVQFRGTIGKLLTAYPRPVSRFLFNPLDTHDTPRLLHTVGSVENAVLAYGLLMTYPGTPCICYGSELGMDGDKHHNRAPMPGPASSCRSHRLRDLLKKLIHLRLRHPSFRSAELCFIDTENCTEVIAYVKRHREESLLVLLNNSIEEKCVRLPEDLQGCKYRDCLSGLESSLPPVISLHGKTPYLFLLHGR